MRVSWLVWGLVLPALLLSACGDDGPDTDTRVLQVEVEKPPADDADPGPVAKPSPRKRLALALPDAGNPLVRIRHGERVDLYDEPGGKVLKSVGDRTEFSSPTAFSVQRTRGAWAGVPTPYFENGRLAWLRSTGAASRRSRSSTRSRSTCPSSAPTCCAGARW